MSELNEMGCEEFANVAAELALGVLTGRERAEALAHLDRCDACRDNVHQLTLTGEHLLGLLPGSEPPPGFETRVMERIGMSAPSPRPADGARGRIGRARRLLRLGRESSPGSSRTGWTGRVRPLVAAVAAAVAVATAALGGWGLRGATSSLAGTPLTHAALVSADHQQVGRIFAYEGSPGWLYMDVDMNAPSGTVICQVVDRDGHVATVGSFQVVNGYGSWGSAEPAGVGPIAGARLLTSKGTILATAMFPRRLIPPRRG